MAVPVPVQEPAGEEARPPGVCPTERKVASWTTASCVPFEAGCGGSINGSKRRLSRKEKRQMQGGTHQGEHPMQDLSIQPGKAEPNKGEKKRVVESSPAAAAVPHDCLRGPQNRRNLAVFCKKLQFVPTESRSRSMQRTEIKQLTLLGGLRIPAREKCCFKLRNSLKRAVFAPNHVRKGPETAIFRTAGTNTPVCPSRRQAAR